MSQGIEFDEAASRRLEAVYLTPDVVGQRCRVLAALDPARGEAVLDIGSGPGLLAHEIAKTVGPEGRVAGIDPSDAMLAMSRRHCAQQPWAAFDRAAATDLPFDDAQFDAAVSTQVYEYVEDIPKAFSELYRVLRPGGRAVILDTDYDSLVMHTEHPERMARVLAAWDEHFVHAGLPRVLAPRLRDAGFDVIDRDVIPMFNPEYHPNTYSYGMIRLIAAFAAGRAGVSRDEAEAWAAEFEELGERGAYFFSLNRYQFVARKP